MVSETSERSCRVQADVLNQGEELPSVYRHLTSHRYSRGSMLSGIRAALGKVSKADKCSSRADWSEQWRVCKALERVFQWRRAQVRLLHTSDAYIDCWHINLSAALNKTSTLHAP